jgi:hypothetical protein
MNMNWRVAGLLWGVALLALSGCAAGAGGDGGGHPVPPKITSQPANQTVTAGRTATFSITASGTAPLSYQWINVATGADISGATSASYTTPPTTLADSGSTFRVNVMNTAGSTLSMVATLTVNSSPPPSNVTVLTYHNDNARTGQNLNETILTTSNVNSTQFGLLGTIATDGPVDAEPLYVGGLMINGAAHNVLFLATENDSVYAFDADTFAKLWQVSVAQAGESPSDTRNCSQVEPTIGVTSTPVIDIHAGPNGTIFVVSMSKDSGGNYHQRLHALDLITHAELNGGPKEISATFPNNGGTTTFEPKEYEERTGLLLLNGTIYLAWTSHCDITPYTGWVMGYEGSSLQQTSVIDVTPNGSDGGIWMSGDGLAADASGNIYFLDGNGTFDTTLNNSGLPNESDFGNAFIKLSSSGNTLAVADYFTMFDTVNQSNHDADFGSGGVVLLPDLMDASNTTRHLAIGAGKPDVSTGEVVIYVVDRDSMGKFHSGSDTIYQEFSPGITGEIKSTPAYFNGSVYYGPVGDKLKAFKITNGLLGTSLTSSSPAVFGYPGTTPSISANGAANGIVWAIENGGSTGTLHAYDASNLTNEIYNSNQASSGRDHFSTNSNCKFVTPMIASGKVYVGTATGVAVFGLLNP